MKFLRLAAIAAMMFVVIIGCASEGQNAAGETEGATPGAGQSAVKDDVSKADILHVAIGSPDHTTLVKAVQAAELENALANAGPFTVFAPTDAAFAKVPSDALADLMKPENKEKLATVLYHHVQVSKYDENRLKNSTQIMMFDGTPAKVEVNGDEITIGGAKILGRVDASNGIVYVVDGVILP